MADDGTRGRSTCGVYIRKTSGKVFPCFTILIPWMLLLLVVQPKSSIAYYVGPEVGHAPGETRVTKATRGFGFGSVNATSLAEAAYVPYVYSVGNNVVTFLRSIIPSLQPKVDFFAEQIQDSIDIANGKLMQTLENSNNGILAAENFFTGLMKAVVFGKGPEDDERRRRLAMALIRSGMLTSTTTTSTTRKPTTMTAATTTTGIPVKRATSTSTVPTTTTSASTTAATTTGTTTPKVSLENMVSDVPMPSQKARDNDFSKMRVMNIVQNML